MKAKKSYGQHFLTNEQLAQRIANSFTAPPQRVLEVGPGKGMLTKYLLDQDFELRVVEADRDMVAYLEEYYPALAANIITGNFLRLKLNRVFDENPFTLIGNFPYNISSQIVFKMLDYRAYVPEMIGMFQREMAERIIAPPGDKTYGVISVLTQAFYEGELLFKVSRGNFNPPPKVESAVIRLVRKAPYDLDCDESLFKSVVKQAFGQRRKMLRNTLKHLVRDPDVLAEDFFKQRPERLSVQDFIALTKRIGGREDEKMGG